MRSFSSSLLFLALLLVFLWAPDISRAELRPMTVTSGTGQAVEGDLVSVNGAIVKLWGVDAPDSGQTCMRLNGSSYDCFTASKDALTRLIGANTVDCHIRGTDSFGQQVGTCGVNGYDLAAMMVRDGWVLAYDNLSPHYDRLQGTAQARRAGLWAGYVEAPWLWRSQQVKRK